MDIALELWVKIMDNIPRYRDIIALSLTNWNLRGGIPPHIKKLTGAHTPASTIISSRLELVAGCSLDVKTFQQLIKVMFWPLSKDQTNILNLTFSPAKDEWGQILCLIQGRSLIIKEKGKVVFSLIAGNCYITPICRNKEHIPRLQKIAPDGLIIRQHYGWIPPLISLKRLICIEPYDTASIATVLLALPSLKLLEEIYVYQRRSYQTYNLIHLAAIEVDLSHITTFAVCIHPKQLGLAMHMFPKVTTFILSEYSCLPWVRCPREIISYNAELLRKKYPNYTFIFPQLNDPFLKNIDEAYKSIAI